MKFRHLEGFLTTHAISQGVKRANDTLRNVKAPGSGAVCARQEQQVDHYQVNMVVI
jgi:flavin-binding protein dodecin